VGVAPGADLSKLPEKVRKMILEYRRQTTYWPCVGGFLSCRWHPGAVVLGRTCPTCSETRTFICAKCHGYLGSDCRCRTHPGPKIRERFLAHDPGNPGKIIHVHKDQSGRILSIERAQDEVPNPLYPGETVGPTPPLATDNPAQFEEITLPADVEPGDTIRIQLSEESEP
jgi:hypothetical protein